MTRALLFVVLALGLSGCGLLIDGAYLVSNKRFSKEERQSKPTELSEVRVEHEVRAQPGQAWLACEEIERNVERVWKVRKDYEHRGGFYQAHWFPLILECLVASALTIGFGVNCAETGAPGSCNGLWATVPLWSDALYSAIRLLTIDPPKLVGKERLAAEAEPSPNANWRRTVSCEPDAQLIVGRFAADPQAVSFRVDAWGAMNQAELPQLMQALQRKDVVVMWAAGGKAPVTAPVGRCELLRQLGSNCID